MAPKRNLKENAVHKRGLDIGYGVTKATGTGMQPVIFPSVWGHSSEIKFKADEIAAKYPGDQITDDDGSWFVGDLALSQLRAGEQRKLRGRTADESGIGNVARLRLLKTALGKMFPGIKNGDVLHFNIATGLPVDHMRGADELKASLIGQHPISTDSTYFIANVTKVMVMPQPYGTIYRNMLTPEGDINPCHAFKTTGVIDIGTYTVDLALDDDGEYIDKQSGSVEAGMYVVQEAIANAYERDFNQKPSYREIETILRKKCVRAFGEPVDYTHEVSNATQALRDATLNLMADKWGNGVGVDVIYVAGGGAEPIFPYIKAAYRQARLVDEAQISNAQGYLNYALFAGS
jgi:hypothetical protein